MRSWKINVREVVQVISNFSSKQEFSLFFLFSLFFWRITFATWHLTLSTSTPSSQGSTVFACLIAKPLAKIPKGRKSGLTSVSIPDNAG